MNAVARTSTILSDTNGTIVALKGKGDIAFPTLGTMKKSEVLMEMFRGSFIRIGTDDVW
jgi:hypothetical protein